MTVRLTERDIDLLYWINGLGFVEVTHIAKKYGISSITAYGRLRKLINSHYLFHERLLHDKAGVYGVTQLGALIADDTLRPLCKIDLPNYRHHLTVVSMSLALTKKYGGAFIPERRLRRKVAVREKNTRSHVSDGILVIDDKHIAIEVELSPKGERRLTKIYRHYIKTFEINEVWYFCGTREVMNGVEKVVKDPKFVKVFSLEEGLGIMG